MRPHRLSPEELAHYRAEGYLMRKAALPAAELPTLRAAVERAATKARDLSARGDTYMLDGKRFVDADSMTVQFEHEAGSDTVRVVEPVHHLDAALDALVDNPRLAQPVRDILGRDDVALWTSKLNLKRPREGSGFGWHQDSPYWMHDSPHVDLLPNVYVALDDADEGNGCLGIIARSHLRGCLPGTDDGSQLGGFFTSPDCFDEADKVMAAMPAGSLLFFDPHAIHGSGPNRSERPRRALILTYQPAGHPLLKTGVVRNVA